MRRTACSCNFSGTYFFEPCFAQHQGSFPSAFGDGQAGVEWEMLAHSDLNYVAFCILGFMGRGSSIRLQHWTAT